MVHIESKKIKQWNALLTEGDIQAISEDYWISVKSIRKALFEGKASDHVVGMLDKYFENKLAN